MAITRLLSLFLLLAVAACGDDSEPQPATTTPPEQRQSQQREVELKLARDEVRPGDTLELTVVNHTRARLEYGVMYKLEHFVDGDWRWINRDSAFILILKVVEPGEREREKIGLPGHLDPGRYRIVKSFTAPPSERELDASVEFTVG